MGLYPRNEKNTRTKFSEVSLNLGSSATFSWAPRLWAEGGIGNVSRTNSLFWFGWHAPNTAVVATNLTFSSCEYNRGQHSMFQTFVYKLRRLPV